jgi:CRP-like cAMP-binding protein
VTDVAPWLDGDHGRSGSKPFAAVRLLDVEPDLAAGLDPEELPEIAWRLVVPGLDVGRGPWTPPRGADRAMGALVVSGVLLREGSVFGRPDVELFGPGDLCNPKDFAAPSNRWRALLDAQVVVLDGRLLHATQRWPPLVYNLTRRLLDCRDQQHQLTAIAAMPRVEERVLALLTVFASRWGQVTGDGLLLTLPVTHQLLGQLVGARRPTVSIALATLRDHGLLVRRGPGRWLLPSECGAWPTTGVPAIRATVQL